MTFLACRHESRARLSCARRIGMPVEFRGRLGQHTDIAVPLSLERPVMARFVARGTWTDKSSRSTAPSCDERPLRKVRPRLDFFTNIAKSSVFSGITHPPILILLRWNDEEIRCSSLTTPKSSSSFQSGRLLACMYRGLRHFWSLF